MNQLGDDPAAKADSNELAKVGLWTISLRKPEGAAVSRTERTGAVGRALASWLAAAPRLIRAAGFVGRVIPASDALRDKSAYRAMKGVQNELRTVQAVVRRLAFYPRAQGPQSRAPQGQYRQ